MTDLTSDEKTDRIVELAAAVISEELQTMLRALPEGVDHGPLSSVAPARAAAVAPIAKSKPRP
jgi:hypothetical protein